MNGKSKPGLPGQESIGTAPRVTPSIHRTPNAEMVTEYHVDGEIYHDVELLEAALRGEIDA